MRHQARWSARLDPYQATVILSPRPWQCRACALENGLLAVPRVDRATLLPIANRHNDYLIDRGMQKTVNYTGIRGISEQDMAMTQSMGPIYDRSQEHLGTSDVAVIAMRRLLLRLAARVQDGGAGPHAAEHAEVYRIRPLDTRSGDPTLEGILEQHEARLRAPAREAQMARRSIDFE
jgi:hypothetical protein